MLAVHILLLLVLGRRTAEQGNEFGLDLVDTADIALFFLSEFPTIS